MALYIHTQRAAECCTLHIGLQEPAIAVITNTSVRYCHASGRHTGSAILSKKNIYYVSVLGRETTDWKKYSMVYNLASPELFM